LKKLSILLLGFLLSANFSLTFAIQIGNYDVTFNGVSYDYQNGTSTWTYTVTGKGGGKNLSHWSLSLCDDHKVTSSNFKYEVVTDPKLGIYGIKWDGEIDKNGGKRTFTFTLNDIYTEASVKAGVKAGTGLYYGFITGPSCEPVSNPNKPVRPILECVQPNGNGTYTAYFGYDNENTVPVTIPIGTDNKFTPAPISGTQPAVFQSGRTPNYPNAAFSVVFNGEELVWTLKGPDGQSRTAVASKFSGSCEQAPEPASLGDRVWMDINRNGIQDNSESGVPAVQVDLYSCAGIKKGETTTDGSGFYTFSGLQAGSYYVKFILPFSYVFSTPDQGTNNETDSDADLTTGKTTCTELIAGENDLSWDAGIYVPDTEKKSDLSLVKTVNNNKPKSGDQITFTITVTNNGPDKATGVIVKDLLKNGFTFVSTNGDYDNVSGLWNVGDLNSGQSKSLEIKVKIEESEIHTTSFDLGIAKDFNLFIFESAIIPSSDTQGRMAVGQSATLSNYSVGDQLNYEPGTVDVLVVGQNLQYLSGAVYNGNVVYGTSTNLPKHAVSISNGVLKQGTPIDFASAQTYLTNLSEDLSNYSVNGSSTMEWGGIKLTGVNPILNVFTISGSDLSNANDFQINVPNGSVVLVNISGKEVKWTGGLKVTGTDIRNVLYNFYEAAMITIQGIDVTGSILAPLAHVNFISGVQNGQMIAKSLEGMGQFNYVMFMGNIPEETTLTNIAEVYTLDQTDPDSTPANGDSDEDDYSSVTVVVNGEKGEENNGGDDDSENWEPTGNSSLTEMIWSLVSYSENIYAGTVGGKIFKSSDNGQNWVRTNNDMSVSWIWAIAIDNNKFYAATEQGIYSSVDGTGWTLCGLEGKDVRTLEILNGTVYAGTWGYGVYASQNGQTWTAMNEDLSCLAVHALAANSKGDLFAGTFGSGVLKYADGKWNKLEVGYDHVWALGITSTDKIYAGTLGGGVYYSANDGETWSTLNDGLPVQFVYSITIDASDNVYLNTWAGGVYGLSSSNNQWFSTGMAGQGVTSVAASMSSATVYLGTEKGVIYKSVKSLTNADNENNTLPVEFSLEQNYPNPFNPSTTIEFSIPSAGNYSIRVYNTLGQMVETLADNNFEAGVHTVQFNAGKLASGVYIYRLTGENVNVSKKMTLTK